MDTRTNILYKDKETALKSGALPGDLKQIPDGLDRASKTALAGNDSVQISKTSGGKLSRFAAQQRREKDAKTKKKKKRNRASRQSRRKNRK